MALERLQDPFGYNLWWLTRSDAIHTEPWYLIFPVLALITLSLLITVPFRHALWPMLVLVIAVNVATRLATDRRIGAAAVAFRQLAPIVATAQALGVVLSEDAAAALRDDEVRRGPLS